MPRAAKEYLKLEAIFAVKVHKLRYCYVGLILMLGILPHNTKHQIKAPASDQVRAHEYTLYEYSPLKQLPTLRGFHCHEAKCSVKR